MCLARFPDGGARLQEIDMAGLPIRHDSSPSDLRTRAARGKDCRAALLLLAIVNVLDGMTRAEAARLARMERQALHDAIQRFNASPCASGISRIACSTTTRRCWMPSAAPGTGFSTRRAVSQVRRPTRISLH